MTSFLIALQFLSRIQLARHLTWTNEAFGASLRCFPLVGGCIGLFLCLCWFAAGLALTGFYRAVCVIIAWFLITGGLHADGFMDTADGLFSGRSRERMLEILKDSRVGSNGVMAFFFLALLKICFLANIEGPAVYAALLGIPVAARYGTLVSVLEFPYARPEGLGKAFAAYAPPRTLALGFLAALPPVLIGGFLYLTLLGTAIAASLILNTYIVKHLGGVTGDTYGAVTESSELLLLGLCAAIY